MKSQRRIEKEFTNLTENPPPGVLITSENMFDSWNLHLSGPEGTPYEGGVFVVKLKFPENYPFKSPKVIFITKIYHPNVNQDGGEVCKQDIVEESWVPTNTIGHVIDMLKTILIYPIPDSPLESNIAQEFIEEKSKFDTNAREWVDKYAKNLDII